MDPKLVEYDDVTELFDSIIKEYNENANAPHLSQSLRDTWRDMAVGISNAKFKFMREFGQ